MSEIDFLDRPVWGALKIGRIAGIIDDAANEAQRRAVYYALEKGHLDADKIGGQWASTPRRILARFAGKAA